MKSTNFPIIILILSSIFFASCNLTKTAEESLDMPDIKVEKGTTGNEVVFDDAATENKGGQVSTYNKEMKKEIRTMPDGKIEIVQDKVGNTIEVRYFNNHPNLSQIMITTRPDGTKEVLAIGHNRENKRISPELSDQAMTLTGPEIANLAGIHSIKQTRSNRSMDGKGPQPPPNTTVTYQTPGYQTPVQPPMNQSEPQNQTTTDQQNPQLTQNKKTNEISDQ